MAGTTTKIPTVNGQAQPWTNTGYTPAQVRGAYNVAQSGETGKGVTVAVIDAYTPPTLKSDANQYAEWAAGQPGGNPALDKPFAKGQFKIVQHPGATTYDDALPTDATDCGAAGWYGESTLDVESVHGMAPNANVTYIGASDCTDQGLGNAVAYVVNTHAASIVTDSWGEPYDQSALVSVYDELFQAGAAEGIGFFFSAGDEGYEDPNYEDASDQVQVDYPDSSPWVTSVGGTSLAIGKNENYEGETSLGHLPQPADRQLKRARAAGPSPRPTPATRSPTSTTTARAAEAWPTPTPSRGTSRTWYRRRWPRPRSRARRSPTTPGPPPSGPSPWAATRA